jgi:hypothetical protein
MSIRLVMMCGAIVLLMTSGCSTVNDKALRAFSSKVSAYAIVGGRLLQGDLNLMPDRTGKVTLLSAGDGHAGESYTCVGSLRYEATHSGVMDLRCSDGAFTVLNYSLISETRGFAYGGSPDVPASLTFGIPVNEATAYLHISSNRKLILTSDDLLELQ